MDVQWFDAEPAATGAFYDWARCDGARCDGARCDGARYDCARCDGARYGWTLRHRALAPGAALPGTGAR